MNTDFPIRFAKNLEGNPSLFGATKDTMLAELLTSYVNGTLPSEDATEVEALLKSNNRAKTVHENILAANRFLASNDGKAWLTSPAQGISENPNIAVGSLLETAIDWIKERFTLFAELPQFEVNTAGDQVFCSDSPSDEQNQRVLNLSNWYGEVELLEKLPWAAHRVVLQKVPIQSKPGMVRYRALVEKRGGAASDIGMLRIVLQAAEQADVISLQADMRSKTFQKAVLLSDAPVAFKPILE